MPDQTIEVSAATLEAARSLLKTQVPSGFLLLSEKILVEGKEESARATGETLEIARAEARGQMPPDAEWVAEDVLVTPERRTLTLEAWSEEAARAQAGSQLAKDEIIQSVRQMVEGSNGFLGIGKRPSQYELEAIRKAEVSLTYRVSARIAGTVARIEDVIDAAFSRGFGEDRRKIVELGDAVVDPLIGRLNDPHSQWRGTTIIVLGEIGSKKAVEPLIAVLNNRDEDVGTRSLAATALGRLGDPAAFESLITYLQDVIHEDEKKIADMVRALEQLGDARACAPLIQLYSTVEAGAYLMVKYDVQKAVINALEKLVDASAVEPLIGTLEQSTILRPKAIEMLGKIGDARAVPALVALIQDPATQEGIVSAALDALGQIGGSEAIEPILEVLTHSASAKTRGAAARALGTLGASQAVEALISALQDEDGATRQTACESLGKLGDARAVEPLIHCLQDKETYVRCAAAEALGPLGDARAIEPLVAVFQDDYDFIRVHAAESLAAIGLPQDPAIQAAQAVIMKDWPRAMSYGQSAIAPVLRAVVFHDYTPNSNVNYVSETRRAAESTARTLIDKHGIEPVIAALHHPDEQVCAGAAYLLGKMREQRAITPLIECFMEAETPSPVDFGRALVNIGEPAVEPLIQKLRQESSHRSAIISLLTDVGSRMAVEPLIELLKDNDTSTVISATVALGKLGDDRAIEPLRALVLHHGNKQVVDMATWVLKQDLGWKQE